MSPLYRIRWSNKVSGPWRGYRRMCLAERQAQFLWLTFYWPTNDGNWRYSEAEALSDIEADRCLRRPLPSARYVD